MARQQAITARARNKKRRRAASGSARRQSLGYEETRNPRGRIGQSQLTFISRQSQLTVAFRQLELTKAISE